MRTPLLMAFALLIGCTPDYEISSGVDAVDSGDDAGFPTKPGPFDLDGDGEIDGDHFDLSGLNPTDIIIYGDTSGSMVEELMTLGDRVLDFTDRLSTAGADWQLMAVTGSTGCGIDGIFTPSSNNFNDRFSQAILTPSGNVDWDEMGLQNVRNAVAESDGGCNNGFVRDGAMLHIIFISDENDESPGFNDNGYWLEYVTDIVAMKGSEALTRFSAVAGPTPDGCNGADPGFGYDSVVDATNGEFISICDNWPDRLDTLADASVVTDIFPLSKTPVLDSIMPFVNGDVREDGWIFDVFENAVIFTENAPMTGDVVDIMYEPA